MFCVIHIVTIILEVCIFYDMFWDFVAIWVLVFDLDDFPQ